MFAASLSKHFQLVRLLQILGSDAAAKHLIPQPTVVVVHLLVAVAASSAHGNLAALTAELLGGSAALTVELLECSATLSVELLGRSAILTSGALSLPAALATEHADVDALEQLSETLVKFRGQVSKLAPSTES